MSESIREERPVDPLLERLRQETDGLDLDREPGAEGAATIREIFDAQPGAFSREQVIITTPPPARSDGNYRWRHWFELAQQTKNFISFGTSFRLAGATVPLADIGNILEHIEATQAEVPHNIVLAQTGTLLMGRFLAHCHEETTDPQARTAVIERIRQVMPALSPESIRDIAEAYTQDLDVEDPELEPLLELIPVALQGDALVGIALATSSPSQQSTHPLHKAQRLLQQMPPSFSGTPRVVTALRESMIGVEEGSNRLEMRGTPLLQLGLSRHVKLETGVLLDQLRATIVTLGASEVITYDEAEGLDVSHSDTPLGPHRNYNWQAKGSPEYNPALDGKFLEEAFYRRDLRKNALLAFAMLLPQLRPEDRPTLVAQLKEATPTLMVQTALAMVGEPAPQKEVRELATASQKLSDILGGGSSRDNLRQIITALRNIVEGLQHHLNEWETHVEGDQLQISRYKRLVQILEEILATILLVDMPASSKTGISEELIEIYTNHYSRLASTEGDDEDIPVDFTELLEKAIVISLKMAATKEARTAGVRALKTALLKSYEAAVRMEETAKQSGGENAHELIYGSGRMAWDEEVVNRFVAALPLAERMEFVRAICDAFHKDRTADRGARFWETHFEAFGRLHVFFQLFHGFDGWDTHYMHTHRDVASFSGDVPGDEHFFERALEEAATLLNHENKEVRIFAAQVLTKKINDRRDINKLSCLTSLAKVVRDPLQLLGLCNHLGVFPGETRDIGVLLDALFDSGDQEQRDRAILSLRTCFGNWPLETQRQFVEGVHVRLNAAQDLALVAYWFPFISQCISETTDGGDKIRYLVAFAQLPGVPANWVNQMIFYRP